MSSLKGSCQSLVRYWQAQGLPIMQRALASTAKHESSLPADFLYLYSQVNGMDQWHNYGVDKEGFAFYAIDELVTCQEEFNSRNSINQDSNQDVGTILLFADYLQKCWYYGVKSNPDGSGSYTIGIIPMEGAFVPITDSLVAFLELYMANADALYDWNQ